MSQSIKQIDEKIVEAEKAIEELKAKREALIAERPETRLARELHSKLCAWNHTDGCGWFYEMKDGVDDWRGDAHSRYLTKASTFIKMCERKGISTDDGLEMFEALRGY
jgi:hypothetical protein